MLISTISTFIFAQYTVQLLIYDIALIIFIGLYFAQRKT